MGGWFSRSADREVAIRQVVYMEAKNDEPKKFVCDDALCTCRGLEDDDEPPNEREERRRKQTIHYCNIDRILYNEACEVVFAADGVADWDPVEASAMCDLVYEAGKKEFAPDGRPPARPTALHDIELFMQVKMVVELSTKADKKIGGKWKEMVDAKLKKGSQWMSGAEDVYVSDMRKISEWRRKMEADIAAK